MLIFFRGLWQDEARLCTVRESRNQSITVKVSARLKRDLKRLLQEDPRAFRSLSHFVAQLLDEAVVRALPAREEAARQMGAQRAAMGKVSGGS